MEKYIDITKNPDWLIVVGELDTVFLDSDNWGEKQWFMYIAYNAYCFHHGKTYFDVIEKGIVWWCGDDITRDSAITDYSFLIKKEVTLLDFYNYIEKYFSLKTMQNIGY